MRGALLALVLATAGASAFPLPANHGLPAVAPVPVESPVGQLTLAVRDLATKVSPADAPFVRYISFATVPKAARPGFRRLWRFWFGHLADCGSQVVPEVEIDPADGTLVRIDIRSAPNWTRAAWVLVADRDYLFREPLLPNRETVFGRLVTGIEVNPATFAAGFILNGYQLFRDSIEAERSPTYFDLLYAYERHPDPDGGRVDFKTVGSPPLVADPGPEPPRATHTRWPGGVWRVEDGGDGRFWPEGSLKPPTPAEVEAAEKARAAWRKAKAAYDAAKAAGQPATPAGQPTPIPLRPIGVKDANKGIKNFPATLRDFQKRWGGEVGKDELKVLLSDPTVGGIALAADSDPQKGSIVAVGGDRLVTVVDSRYGWVGVTYDVTKNTGAKDPIEQFREIAARGKRNKDGGEALATKRNGSQAGFLFNAEEERVDKADPNLAQIRSDKIDPRYKDVRTMMGCVACHAPTGGFNTFVEQFRESIEKGIRFKVYPENDAAVRDFFLSWDRRVKRWNLPYAEFIEATTLDAKTGKGWTGQQTWEFMRQARDAYDRPVSLEVAAFEFGWDAESLRRVLLGAGEKDSPIDARLNSLVVGKPINRRVWQEEVAFKLALFLDARKGKEEPLKELLAPQLIEDALRRFGHKGGGVK